MKILYLVYEGSNSVGSSSNRKSGSCPLWPKFASGFLAVLLLSKKHRKKVMGVMIGAMGQSLLLPVEVAALQNQVLRL